MSEFQYLDGGNTEAQDRLATSFLLAQDSTGLATDGVLSGLTVAQTTTASGSVTIAAGAGAVQDTVLAGVALLVNDSQKTLDVLGANPMGGTPRNDIVGCDAATVSGGSGGLRVLVGTPNAVPTDPTVPATAIPLARIRNAASATTVPSSAIDDLRTHTRLAGASRSGGAPYAVASGGGNIGVDVTAGSLSGPYAQTFPAGRFTQVPNLTFGTTDARCSVQGTSITTSGFNLYVRNNSSSTAPAGQIVSWTATQMTPTSASG